MLELIGLAVTGALAIGGYVKTRGFVRRRLRFVEAVHRPAAPLVVGGLTALVSMPLVALPIVGWVTVGWVTALALGAGVGLGVKHGSRDSKRMPGF